MSSIDDVEMDVDIDGEGHTVATLVLHGDFTTVCEDYLDPELHNGTLRLRIDHKVAYDLVKEIDKHL
jgi:hypothetical protein